MSIEPGSHPAYLSTSGFPREFLPGMHWLGGCSNSAGWPGREHLPAVHEPISIYLVVGTERTVLVDPGHSALWYAIEGQLEEALAGRPLDYVFPTHPEVAHAGNLSRVCRVHPETAVIGDIRDYWVFHPGIDSSRYHPLRAGESVSLGSSDFVMIEPVWRDLTATLWGYETAQQVLFPSDGVGVLHPHEPGVCGLLPEEYPDVDQADPRWLALRGPFHWMSYTDPGPSCAEFRTLLEAYPVSTVCSAHGAPVRDPQPFLHAVIDAVAAGHRGGSLSTGGPVPANRDEPAATEEP
jgi:flavorubredoxin